MVIKKKRIYKKQKGGMKEIDRICICSIIINTVVITNPKGNKLDEIDRIIEELNIFINKNIKYSLFINMITNINKCIQTIQNIQDIQDIKIIIKNILEIIIESLLSNFSQNLNFFDKFLKIYIHLLFIEYLFVQDNQVFKSLFMQLLKNNIFKKNTEMFSKYYSIIKETKQDNLNELQQQLHNLFLHDYSTEYGIPVFYGGLLFDSQYNEFVCRQVGASSNKKRNFIINPVLAFAYRLFYKLIIKEPEIKQILKIINKLSKTNQSITNQSIKKLIAKINNYLIFNDLINRLFIKKLNQYAITKLIEFVIKKFTSEPETITTDETRENYLRRLMSSAQLTVDQKVRNNYYYLYSNIHVPKLGSVSTDSQFCIALNQFGEEEIIKPSTFSKCAWKYGCNLKMTPEIRDENISSMTDILNLAQILLLIVLNKGDNIFIDTSNIQDFMVNSYINLFYNRLEGRQINNRIIRSKINNFDTNKITKLVQRLSILYKYFLIQKINILSKNQYANISEINLKLEMIIIELRNFKSLFDYFKYLHDFLSEEQDNICKNDSKFIIQLKLFYFNQELDKIKRLIR